jgi:hypothetical protein
MLFLLFHLRFFKYLIVGRAIINYYADNYLAPKNQFKGVHLPQQDNLSLASYHFLFRQHTTLVSLERNGYCRETKACSFRR